MTRRSLLAAPAGGFLLGFSLPTIGCNTSVSPSITALNAVADAASVAVIVVDGLVAAHVISQADSTIVTNYAAAIGVAVSSSIGIINSSKPNPQKISEMLAAFGQAVAPVIVPGMKAEVAAVIIAITSAVQLFLRQLGSGPLLAAANTHPHASLQLTYGDKQRLRAIERKVAETRQGHQ